MAKSRAKINEENIESDSKTRGIDWKAFKDETVPVGTRLPENMKKALQVHFESKGLKLSQGVRMIISEYMEKARIR